MTITAGVQETLPSSDAKNGHAMLITEAGTMTTKISLIRLFYEGPMITHAATATKQPTVPSMTLLQLLYQLQLSMSSRHENWIE